MSTVISIASKKDHRLRLLHTSDWHLGRLLHGKKRYDEFARFLDWLIGTVRDEQVDLLIIAGDVFDTTTPSNRAQELYYSFLGRVAATSCRHVIVVAGNHDSPSFLDAPRALLKALRVHVTGALTGSVDNEVLVIDEDDSDGKPLAAVVCAVPYLRESDIRSVAAGESIDDKTTKMLDGIKEHYAAVHAVAEVKRVQLQRKYAGVAEVRVPVITTGHLFTAGGLTVEGDGVRELYVGSLVHTDCALFDERIDYLALGHLHVPQMVGGNTARRYSGSPIAMGFGETAQKKSVVIADFSTPDTHISLREIPVFRPLVRIRGDLSSIASQIRDCTVKHPDAWLEIRYEGDEVAAKLQEDLGELVKDTLLEIVRIRNNRVIAGVLEREYAEEEFTDITPEEVFNRCLAANTVPETQCEELRAGFRELVRLMDEEDAHAG